MAYRAVRFGGASFSGGSVSFADAQFSGSEVNFGGTRFSGGAVHFARVLGGAPSGLVPTAGQLPPPGLILPPAWYPPSP
ncbi:pentapeptide repeat-containing protein [Streptomyces sp. NPDC056437]|uniref:pentapeptide repeat-containing protein n=1 Tax=Streptomyces sp. NPDC056437 TaxID=3345816 RepID=UPI00367EE7D0